MAEQKLPKLEASQQNQSISCKPQHFRTLLNQSVSRALQTKIVDQKFRELVAEWSRQRRTAGPVGPQLQTGRGWCVAGYRTVQVVRIGDGKQCEFAVIVLFPFAYIDLRFPPLRFRTLTAARRGALDRAREASGGCQIEFPGTWSQSIEFVRCGAVLCFEAL